MATAAGRKRLAAAKKRASAKKKNSRKQAARNGATRAGSKMEKAVLIMERMFVKQQKPRAEIIAALISEAGLTKGGAPTYYQLIKSKMERDEA